MMNEFDRANKTTLDILKKRSERHSLLCQKLHSHIRTVEQVHIEKVLVESIERLNALPKGD